jgi:hypothetical protein
MIRYQGELYSLRGLAAKMDQHRETIRARHIALGQPSEVFPWLFLPRAEWEECLNIFKRHGVRAVNEHVLPLQLTVKKEQKAYDPNDRSPGWAERKYFPNTGQHGFHGGKASTGACVAGHCDIPMLAGD